jgi:hypothetical protein
MKREKENVCMNRKRGYQEVKTTETWSKIWIKKWGEAERGRHWVGHSDCCSSAGSRNCRIDSPLIYEEEFGEMSSCLWTLPRPALFSDLLMTTSSLVGPFSSPVEMEPGSTWSCNDSMFFVPSVFVRGRKWHWQFVSNRAEKQTGVHSRSEVQLFQHKDPK